MRHAKSTQHGRCALSGLTITVALAPAPVARQLTAELLDVRIGAAARVRLPLPFLLRTPLRFFRPPPRRCALLRCQQQPALRCLSLQERPPYHQVEPQRLAPQPALRRKRPRLEPPRGAPPVTLQRRRRALPRCEQR